MATYAVDWDGTLVDATSQEWLPGAIPVMQRWLIAGHKIIVHSARASFPEGRQQIIDGLAKAHLDHPNVTVADKPLADVYVDNLAVRYQGDWTQTERDVAAGTSPAPAVNRARRPVSQTGYAAVPVVRPTFGIRR